MFEQSLNFLYELYDQQATEFPAILEHRLRKEKKRFPVKLICFGKPRDFLDYQSKSLSEILA